MMSQRSRLPWLSCLMILGCWVPLYMGIKARRKDWIAWGAFWVGLTLVGAFLPQDGSNPGGGVMAIAWIGAIVNAFVIRSTYVQLMQSPLVSAMAEGRIRLEERQVALQTAQQNPALAREVGIGRPDEQGAVAAGLVDVNNAGASALVSLPGVTDALATRIIETRAEINGFASLEDLGTVLDLRGDAVERLRGHVVFLPR